MIFLRIAGLKLVHSYTLINKAGQFENSSSTWEEF
jgi:hypothetical protein